MQTNSEIRGMSAHELAMLGVQAVAYVKPVWIEGIERFTIHAADGTPMAMLDDRRAAFAVIRQNDLEPVSVH